jgi:serine/threonine protein kinase
MDLSLQFRPTGGPMTTTRDGSTTNSRESGDIDVLMGDYINTCIKSDILRSVIGNSDRMRYIGEGASYRVYQAKIVNPARADSHSPKYVLCAVKMLRGTPMNKDHGNYAMMLGFQKVQLEAVCRDVAVLCHQPLRTHENIISLLEFGFNTQGNEDEPDEDWQLKQPFLVVEYAHQTLKDFLASSLSKDIELRRKLALDMTAGMEALHSCDIIHGDFKPENVLVFTHPDRKHSAKLSDFGHSIIGRDSTVYYGTEKYLPPEVRSHDEAPVMCYSELRACDIWALSAALFEIMKGRYFASLDASKRGGCFTTTDDILNDEDLAAQLGGLDEKSQDLWTSALRLALQTNPTQRGTARDIRLVLDVNQCQQEVLGSPI